MTNDAAGPLRAIHHHTTTQGGSTMADRTGIEWTDATWNPVTGCTEVSPGCDHCYARTFAERWRGIPGHYFERGFDVQLRPDKLDQPLRWRRPRRVFVNSMSDLFHTDVPADDIAQVFAVMASTDRHTFQVLTKRHARMRSLLSSAAFRATVVDWLRHWGHEDDARLDAVADVVEETNWPLRNVWLGVSVEDQKWADTRIPALMDTPAAVRFLSCEPLLGPVDLSRWLLGRIFDSMEELFASIDEDGHQRTAVDWVIVGGESGAGARPMHPDWARRLRDQCQAALVPFLFKQWGEWAPTGQVGIGTTAARERLVGSPDERGFREVIRRVGKKSAGRVLDGRAWDEFPEVAR